MSATPKYDALAPAVRTIIDRSAAMTAATNGCTVDQARELLAARVITKTSGTQQGTGH